MRLSKLCTFILGTVVSAIPAIAPHKATVATDVAPPGRGNCGWLDYLPNPKDETAVAQEQLNDRAHWCYKVPGEAHTVHVNMGCACYFHSSANCADDSKFFYLHGDTTIEPRQRWKHEGFTCVRIGPE